MSWCRYRAISWRSTRGHGLTRTFGDGTNLAGLSLLFQVSSLTNEAYQTYAGTKDRPLEHIEWGRTYLVGLNYRF